MNEDAEMNAAREAMIARRFGGANMRTGGKGTARRKKKSSHKTATADDKKLTSTLKKLNVTTIPGIEEVNMFKSDSSVVHFEHPKVQASIGANTYVVSGPSETKPLQDLLPGIITQLGTDSLNNLRQLAETLGASGELPGGLNVPSVAQEDGDDDDDDVPDLVEDIDDFEAVAAK